MLAVLSRHLWIKFHIFATRRREIKNSSNGSLHTTWSSTFLNFVQWPTNAQLMAHYYKLLQIVTNYYKLLQIITNYYTPPGQQDDVNTRLYHFLNNQPDALITQIYSVIKLYIFGTGKFHAVFWWPPPSRVRMVPSWLCLEAFIKNLYETYQCRMYSRKLLMMGREDARNMSIFNRINLDN